MVECTLGIISFWGSSVLHNFLHPPCCLGLAVSQSYAGTKLPHLEDSLLVETLIAAMVQILIDRTYSSRRMSGL